MFWSPAELLCEQWFLHGRVASSMPGIPPLAGSGCQVNHQFRALFFTLYYKCY